MIQVSAQPSCLSGLVMGDFPGGLGVEIPCFHCRAAGSIPGWDLRSCVLCDTARKKERENNGLVWGHVELEEAKD